MGQLVHKISPIYKSTVQMLINCSFNMFYKYCWATMEKKKQNTEVVSVSVTQVLMLPTSPSRPRSVGGHSTIRAHQLKCISRTSLQRSQCTMAMPVQPSAALQAVSHGCTRLVLGWRCLYLCVMLTFCNTDQRPSCELIEKTRSQESFDLSIKSKLLPRCTKLGSGLFKSV